MICSIECLNVGQVANTNTNSSVPRVSILTAKRTRKAGGGSGNADSPTLRQRFHVLGSGKPIIFINFACADLCSSCFNGFVLCFLDFFFSTNPTFTNFHVILISEFPPG